MAAHGEQRTAAGGSGRGALTEATDDGALPIKVDPSSIGEFRPVPLGDATFAADFAVRRATIRSRNVVGRLPGSAQPDETILYGAHWDHLGVGVKDARGDSIYNGAVDNATGVAAVIELGRAFARGPRPQRTVVFAAWTAEEKGLLGSEYFSDHPTVPLGSIVANVNMDMIGRNTRDTVVVIGKNYSSLGDVVTRAAADNRQLVGLTPADDRWPEERFFFRSDHFNFARKEIPAIFFFAGVHEDYHEPSDEVERLDVDKAARVARMIFLTTHAIATTPQRPTWTAAGLREVRRMINGG